MGEYVIKLPDIGEGVAEAEVVEWMVTAGDVVHEDQVLVSVMTDKAAVELPSPTTGTVISLGAQVGEMLAVGAELLRLEVSGAGNIEAVSPRPAPAAAASDEASPATSESEMPAAEPTASEKTASTPATPVPAAGPPPSSTEDRRPEPPRAHTASRDEVGTETRSEAAFDPAPPRPEGEKPIAAPAVRHRARNAGVDLRFVSGSGPAGRITHADLDRVLARAPQTSPDRPTDDSRSAVDTPKRTGETPQTPLEPIKLSGLRRAMCTRMQDAWSRIPHISYVEEIDVTSLESLRARLNERYASTHPRLTLLPFLMRAICLAAREHPDLNATFDDEQGVLMRSPAVHIGVATQTDAGLLVPVVRDVQSRDPWSCARAVESLAETARSGRAGRDVLSGSTITITSLGALGGVVTTPIINPPEVAIVGVNRIRTLPVYVGDSLMPRKMMNLSSSFDHRVIDGHSAASFIQAIRALLEEPALLFIEPPREVHRPGAA